MSSVINLETARSRQISLRVSTFWQIVDRHVRSDFTIKKNWLLSVGCRTVMIAESRGDTTENCGHIVLMFSGTGPLRGYSFAFAVRHSASSDLISAEVLVTDSASTTILSKVISSLPLPSYTDTWLYECAAAAMSILAPIPEAAQQASLG